jgi:tetratricopeptide (TPR) repeat protein
MSSSVEEQKIEEVCASCGKAALDDVKLKKCACDLVKYCSVDCQKNHRPQHKKACKKRLAEIRDDQLFTQPDENYLGECSICCLPLPLDEHKWRINACCCKRICDGCGYSNQKREWEQGLAQRCPYCREPFPKTDEEVKQNYMERVKANDPIALLHVGKNCYDEGNYEGAFQYWTKAAKLGEIGAHQNLSLMYATGEGVEKDEKKEVYHLEIAAIGGHPDARHNLGCNEGNRGRLKRAMQHFIIAANLGCDEALEEVKKGFRWGVVSKDDYEAALRGHQAAVDATKSEQRDAAQKAIQEGRFY